MSNKLLDSEWIILRALWGQPPQSMKQIIAAVQQNEPGIAWHYKTYHSYLRVMLDKGLIDCQVLSARDKLYFSITTKEQALSSENESLLSRISKDSMGRLVAMMATSGQIEPQDQKELLRLFQELSDQEGKS